MKSRLSVLILSGLLFPCARPASAQNGTSEVPLTIRINGNESDSLTKSFDIEILNPNDKPVTCLSGSITLYIGQNVGSSQCMRESFEMTSFPFESFKLSPSNGSSKEFTAFGEQYLLDFAQRGNYDLNDIEYCAREMPQLKCGFDCTNGKSYGDEWWEYKDSANQNGILKTCDSRGEIVDKEARCGDRKAPTTWQESGPHGTITRNCSPYADLISSIECDAGYQRDGDKLICIPKTCDNGLKFNERRKLNLSYRHDPSCRLQSRMFQDMEECTKTDDGSLVTRKYTYDRCLTTSD